MPSHSGSNNISWPDNQIIDLTGDDSDGENSPEPSQETQPIVGFLMPPSNGELPPQFGNLNDTQQRAVRDGLDYRPGTMDAFQALEFFHFYVREAQADLNRLLHINPATARSLYRDVLDSLQYHQCLAHIFGVELHARMDPIFLDYVARAMEGHEDFSHYFE